MTNTTGFEVKLVRAETFPARLPMLRTVDDRGFPFFSAEEEAGASPDEDASLDEAAEDEREYVRRRLLDELKREPSEEEVDEWLRRHTEGY